MEFRQERTVLNISRQSSTCAKLLIPTVPTLFSVVTHSVFLWISAPTAERGWCTAGHAGCQPWPARLAAPCLHGCRGSLPHIFTFLEIIKHSITKMLRPPIFNIQMATQKVTNFDNCLEMQHWCASCHNTVISSVAQSCPTVCNPMNCSTPGLLVHHQLPELPKFMSIESVMPSSHLILCCPLLLLPPIPPSIRIFSNESTLCMRRPKYWSFSFSISPSNEQPGLISSRIDWLDLLAVQGTLKSLLRHHSSKASILRCSAFFMVPLSHPYMTTGKATALTRRTFVSKEMSLLFNVKAV